MYFFIFLMSLILLFVIALFILPFRIAASFNSEQLPQMHLMMTWLNPFLKGYITRQDKHTTLEVKLLNKKIFTKELKGKKFNFLDLKRSNYRDYIHMAKSIKLHKGKLYASYGFIDPSSTGIICGIIDFISQYINLDELYNNADFFTNYSYFNISAEFEINIGISIVKILTRKVPYLNAHILHQYR